MTNPDRYVVVVHSSKPSLENTLVVDLLNRRVVATYDAGRYSDAVSWAKKLNAKEDPKSYQCKEDAIPGKEEFLKALAEENIKQYTILPNAPKLTQYVVEFRDDRAPATIKAVYWEETGKYYSFIAGKEDVVASFRTKDVFSIIKVGHTS